ncbi:MAG: EamA family transporter, partial [Kiloniellales bacterium]
RSLPHVNTMALSFHMSTCGTLVGAVVILASGALALPTTGVAGWGALAATILCFAAAFLGMFAGVRMIGALRTSMIMNLEPVATIGLAVLLLGESLTAQQLVGAALVLGAVAVAQRPAAR